jgi:type I restriction-modification system DNA methylase subunit
MMNKETAKQDIKVLVDKYNKIVDEGRFSKYNEEMTKKDFILPLFRALGWKTEDSGEVTAEEKISKKRVDYSFRITGIPKFFLEAKSLKADLDNAQFIDQAINYAWHKGCTWAVLTDFESIKIFNAEWKTANPLQSHLKTIQCNEYMDRFNELWFLSKEGFEQGLLDREAEKWGKKTKKSPVDKQLLEDFTRFREMLSKNINLLNGNRKLTGEELNESVQRILDRLIFIRNCEDRGLEGKTLISIYREWESSGRGHMIKNLRINFAYFDKEYNSKIFSKHLCDELEVDNEILHEIIEGLYYTKDNSVSYDFSAIEADVLGNIYEQYLSHILRKSAKGTKLTENHVHRKEQGIYYTPTYIVDYIVRSTLGELLKDRKVNVDKIRVLDPACGSGSFLIKAFDLINQHHKKHDRQYSQTRLDLETGIPYTTKVKILQNNIHGVDLDRQAVEIAQLNLLLKIAEKGHRLPLLQENLKFGNSLIDNPAVAGKKAFDWHKQFGRIMDEGGFDVVIGNPPYGIIFKENEKYYLEKHYTSFRRNNDMYVAFIEKSLNLLKDKGLFSFIIPNTYLIGSYFDNLKKIILNKARILKIIDFGVNHVFQDPNVFNSIIILQKEPSDAIREKNVIEFYDVLYQENLDIYDLESISTKTDIVQSKFNDLAWKPKNVIIERIYKKKDRIVDDVCYVKDVGFNYWSIGRGKKRGGSIGSRILYDGERQNQKDIPFLKGRDIDRYCYSFGGHWLRNDYEKYLNKKTDVFRFTPKYLEISPKIIYRQTADRIIATIDYDKYYLDKTVHLIVPKENVKLNIFSMLGVLNSTLMLYLYRDMVREEGRTFAQVKTVYIKKIPLRFNEKIEKKISELVKRQLESNERLNGLGDRKTDERARIEEEVQKTDLEIDDFVYKLYEITDAERKIIEESLK